MLSTLTLKVSRVDERTLRIEKAIEERNKREAIRRFNLAPYFPISSLTILGDFLSNSEGNFTEKKEEFEVYLNSCCTLVLDMDNFSARLLKTLFRKDFIRDHRWPSVE